MPTLTKNDKDLDSTTKRIAKNTVMLYFRQILIMIVSLFTVRVVLSTLGEVDYGIYNVVAGVVVMFGFVSTALSTAGQRYLSFEIGKKNEQKVSSVFFNFCFVMFFVSLIISLASGIGGYVFIQTKMNIPETRLVAAKKLLLFSVGVTFFNTIRIPFNSLIVSKERMDFFALISIIEVVLKLLVVYVLNYFHVDKLILYGILLFIVSFLVFIFFMVFCYVSFEETKITKTLKNKSIIKEILSFSWWSLFGGFANMANTQGITLIINVFCGVAVNAALGIATQVYNAVYQFVSNFQMAFNPGLVKLYAQEKKDELFVLINRTGKFSYYLLLFIVVPLFVNVDFVLSSWLEVVPADVSIFLKLLLIEALCSPLNGPFWMIVQASGKIAKYQILVSLIIILNLPISYIFLKLGYGTITVLIVKIIIQVAVTVFRILYIRITEKFPLRQFIFEVVLPIIPITCLSFISVYGVSNLINNEILSFFISCSFSVIVIPLFIIILGMKKNERKYFMNKIFKGEKNE